MKKKFVIARVKSGALRGFFLLDSTWSKEEREQVINIIKGINGLDEPDAERN